VKDGSIVSMIRATPCIVVDVPLGGACTARTRYCARGSCSTASDDDGRDAVAAALASHREALGVCRLTGNAECAMLQGTLPAPELRVGLECKSERGCLSVVPAGSDCKVSSRVCMPDAEGVRLPTKGLFVCRLRGGVGGCGHSATPSFSMTPPTPAP